MREFQDCLRRPQYILTHQYIEGNHPSPQLHLNFTSTSPQIHLSWSRFDKHALQMKIIPNSLNELFPSWHTNKWVGGEKAIDHSFCQSCFPPLCYLLPGNYHLFSPVHTSSTATTVLKLGILTFGILGNSFCLADCVSKTWKFDCWQNNWIAGVYLQRCTSPIYINCLQNMTLGMISWGGVYYAASAHPKQYFCPLSSRHWITHGQGRDLKPGCSQWVRGQFWGELRKWVSGH